MASDGAAKCSWNVGATAQEWLGLTGLWPNCSITWKTVAESGNTE